MTLKHVQRGDPFPTDEGTVNAWTEAGMAHAIGRGGMGEGDFTPVPQPGIVLVKNTSGVARNRFDVLGIDDTVFPTPAANLDAFKAGPIFYGVTPDVAKHEHKFVVLLAPIAVDGIEPAAISGPTIARVNVTSASHNYVRIADGDAGTLRSATAGCPILYQESGTGAGKWAEVHLGMWVESGPVMIRFEVLSAGPFLGDGLFECDYVVAEVLHVSCQGAGVEVGDEVNIWDPSRCQFNLPIEVLIGAHGWATSMTNDTEGVVDCLYELAAEGECRWVVQSLCCVEEIYG